VVCLLECNREASIMRRSWPCRGCCANEEKVSMIPGSNVMGEFEGGGLGSLVVSVSFCSFALCTKYVLYEGMCLNLEWSWNL
jgi:hypothetical protein